MRFHIQFVFDDEHVPAESPSTMLGIEFSPGTRTVPGIGDFEILENTRGDRDGGLWDANFYAILDVFADISINIIAGWIVQRAMQPRTLKVTTLKIEGKPVPIDEAAIREALENLKIPDDEPPAQ